MDLGVAGIASLILIGHVVKRRRARRGKVHGGCVALQAQRVHVVPRKQAGIRRSVGEMAGETALSLDGWMFIHKGSHCIGVTFHADCILVCAGLQHLVLKCAVWIMAVAAFQQAFIDLVVEGLREGSLYIGVALITKLRFGDFE